MIISIINFTTGKTDDEVQDAIRAVNRQIAEDFGNYWHLDGVLRLEGESGSQPTPQTPVNMRGDAVIYLWDNVNANYLGFHDQNNRGVPFGFVFTDLAESLDPGAWTITLSHEALELLADPQVNLLALGPHPDPNEQRDVFHWYEMCDAVQDESYAIDGVKVSNFVLPLYFTADEQAGGRNDFLGTSHNGGTLKSFGVNPGGYVGFFDPVIGDAGDHDTWTADNRAKARLDKKTAAKATRRAIRCSEFVLPGGRKRIYKRPAKS